MIMHTRYKLFSVLAIVVIALTTTVAVWTEKVDIDSINSMLGTSESFDLTASIIANLLVQIVAFVLWMGLWFGICYIYYKLKKTQLSDGQTLRSKSFSQSVDILNVLMILPILLSVINVFMLLSL